MIDFSFVFSSRCRLKTDFFGDISAEKTDFFVPDGEYGRKLNDLIDEISMEGNQLA